MLAQRREEYHTPPSHAPRKFNLSYSSSDEASDDGDDVPPTPGDIESFHAYTSVSGGTRTDLTRNGVDLSKLFDNVASSARIEDDGTLSLSPIANIFYPSFGDFLPAVKSREEASNRENGLGLSDWNSATASPTDAARVEGLSNALSRQLSLQDAARVEQGAKISQVASPIPGASVFAPFATFSPNTDSFTFCPSPDWKETDRRPGPEEEQTATSASLRSPEPNRALPTFPMQRSLSTSNSSLMTPPSTPVRISSLKGAPLMQQSRSLPVPQGISPSRSPFAVAPSPTRASFHQQLNGMSSPVYPLSPIDTERIAKLHNGRVPTLEQLCPEPVNPAAQPPIVNTGNQGVMVVQQGDWKCGTCSFVNWRRRKICLRCFPFANDIGNILTIQSQRAAHLATPFSAPAHQTTFAIPSPTRSHFDKTSVGMSRAHSYAPFQPQTRPAQGHLLAPPLGPVPHSASPTRSTFVIQTPPSPTRYLQGNMSPSPYHRQHYTELEPRGYMSNLSPPSAGDLALRRSARMQQQQQQQQGLAPSTTYKAHPRIEPLNLVPASTYAGSSSSHESLASPVRSGAGANRSSSGLGSQPLAYLATARRDSLYPRDDLAPRSTGSSFFVGAEL
ncbi:zinc finger Ran-binding domain-containing protein [Sporobolomyces koalae]|uniref:zinc finger Ran-binding domain-containing protein n=1 Tax=Sporobolomyces koalae TaxID=500713 RepID=UPI003181989C